jgi:hypothetical protein
MKGHLRVALLALRGNRFTSPLMGNDNRVVPTVLSRGLAFWTIRQSSDQQLPSSQTDQPPIIRVIGKAFWDVGHASKDQSNRRKYMPGCAIWKIIQW